MGPHHIPVEYLDQPAAAAQLLLEQPGNRRLAGARKTGKPDRKSLWHRLP
jgi:hypothetical protein